MIVPDYWAQARKQHKTASRQVTVRRYGWSLSSQADAQDMAERRADEALQRILAGERLVRREPKLAYNGATGTPIREEVLARHGAEVITRNAYGAHCLNSPQALFADIDFDGPDRFQPTLGALALACVAFVVTGMTWGRWDLAFFLLVVAVWGAESMAGLYCRLVAAVRGGPETVARRRITRFLAANPAWNVRLYQTPAGYRVLATHQAFSATADDVQRFFSAVSADPVYVRMCTNQGGFRARLTAKPWRIGITANMRPRPGVWPVQPAFLAMRKQWIADYERKAAAFAACRYIGSIGSGVIHESIRPIIELHDRESRALSDARLA